MPVDLNFSFNRALYHHQGEEAANILATVVEMAPEHRLRHHMETGLAHYDDDEERAAKSTEALAKLFPEDPRLISRQVFHARRASRRRDVLDLLRKTATAKNAHPSRWRDLAIELSSDARETKETWKWLRKAHAYMPFDTGILEAWADQWWNAGKKEWATDAYGFASSWSPSNERLARVWSNAERLVGRRQQALDRLRARYQRLGRRSADPGRTLLWALDDFNHEEEAEAVLVATLEKHPDDGQFLLTASAFHSARGRHEESDRYLARAETRCPRGVWLRTRARAESACGRNQESLALWREVADREPMATDAHGQIAWLLSLLESAESAHRHLDDILSRFPYHLGLHHLRVTWLREAESDTAEPAIRALLDVHPNDAWAWRELAVVLGESGRRDEAVEAARSAHTLAPSDPSSCGILAAALEAIGDAATARAWHRQALALNVDYTFSQHGLLGLAGGASERRSELAYIHGQMIAQVLAGPSVSCYREVAFPLLEPQNLLEELRTIHRERPDIPESWSVLTRHLIDMGKAEEARTLAMEATVRLARIPGVWIDAARVHRHLTDLPAALACARTATEINPNWADGWLVLADYTEDAGHPEEAVVILENASKRIPHSASLRGFLAGLLWRLGESERAFAEALEVARRFPSDQGSWRRLDEWADTLGRRNDVATAARKVCTERPGEARSWLLLARTLSRSNPGEAVEAYNRTISLNPRLADAYDEKALLLSQQGRFTEAEEACHPAAFGDAIPFTLLGRAAWLTYLRGKSDEAIKRMEELLEIHPDYFWGWQQLLEWAGEKQNKDLAARARAALLRLAPNNIFNLCNAGEAALAENNQEEAARHFQMAISQDPSAPYPLHQWLRIAWNKRDARVIEDTAARALPGLPQAISEAFLILARAGHANRKEVESRLDKLLATTQPIGPAAADLEKGFAAIGQSRLWKNALNRAGKRGDIGMAFARSWISMQISSKRWKAWKQFDAWIARAHEEALDPIAHYFTLLGESSMARQAAGFFHTKAADWCRKRSLPFGQIGFALVCSNWWDKTIEWLDGAEDRDDAQGWLCTNLIIALSESGREEEACAVAEKVVTRELRDHTWACSASQAAFGMALAGDIPAARNHLQEAGDGDKAPFWKWKWLLADELSSVLALPPGSKEASRRQKLAISRLKNFARTTYPDMRKPLQLLYRRVVRTMARHTGRRLWPWSFYLGLPIRF